MAVAELVKKDRDIENRKLIQLYRETENEDYKEEFFTANKRMSAFVADKFKNTGLEFEDLEAIAYMGMVKAFNSYDPTKDIKFMTYGSRCMENEILMFLRKNKRHMGIGSLDFTINEDDTGNELTMMDIIEDNSSKEIPRYIEQEAIKKLVKELKHGLNDRNLFILENMLSEDRMTQPEVAERFNLSQSYISRLETRLQNKARKIAHEIGLKGTSEIEDKKELGEMNSKVIKGVRVEGQTKREQIRYIMENYPSLANKKDIAELLDIPANTVKTYMSTIRKEQEKPMIQKPKAIDVSDKIIKEATPKLTAEELMEEIEKTQETDAVVIPATAFATEEPVPKKPRGKSKTILEFHSVSGAELAYMLLQAKTMVDTDSTYSAYVTIERHGDE